MDYQRILLKLSGLAFRGKDSIFDFVFADKIVFQIKKLVQLGKKVVIVLGAGNICRAKDFVQHLNKSSQVPLDYSGMLGTMINGLILKELFAKAGMKVGLLSSVDVSARIAPVYNFDSAEKILQDFGALILTGGVGLPNFSTDFAAVLRGKELNVDVVLFGKNGIDGVYSNDPKSDNQAKWIFKVSFHDVIAKKLEFIDFAAAAFGLNEKIDLLVFNLDKENSILNVLKHKGRYSIVTNQ